MGDGSAQLVVAGRAHGVFVAVAVVGQGVEQDAGGDVGAPLAPGGSHQFMPSQLVQQPEGAARGRAARACGAGEGLDRGLAAVHCDGAGALVDLDHPGSGRLYGDAVCSEVVGLAVDDAHACVALAACRVEVVLLACDGDPAVDHAALVVKVVGGSISLEPADDGLSLAFGAGAQEVGVAAVLQPAGLHLEGLFVEIIVVAVDLAKASSQAAVLGGVVAYVAADLDEATGLQDALGPEVVAELADALHAGHEAAVLVGVVGLLAYLEEAVVVDDAVAVLPEVVEVAAAGRDLADLLQAGVDCAGLGVVEDRLLAGHADCRDALGLGRGCCAGLGGVCLGRLDCVGCGREAQQHEQGQEQGREGRATE